MAWSTTNSLLQEAHHANDFHIRVELHGVLPADERKVYEDLHEVMRTRGYFKMITAVSGETYHLPRAEYTKRSGRSTREVLTEVESIVPLAWGGQFAAMAILSAECWFKGLEPVRTSSILLRSIGNPYLPS